MDVPLHLAHLLSHVAAPTAMYKVELEVKEAKEMLGGPTKAACATHLHPKEAFSPRSLAQEEAALGPPRETRRFERTGSQSHARPAIGPRP